jgi:putative transposase
MKPKNWLAWRSTNKVVQDGGVFDCKEELLERLRQGPGDEARREVMPSEKGPTPSRWILRSIRASFPRLADYTLSGVWYFLQGLDLQLRSPKVQMWSPDPEYASKKAHLLDCLRQTALHSKKITFLFMDEMSYYRWADPSAIWEAETPIAERAGGNNCQWRMIGVLNALSGQTDYLDNYIIGRRQLIAMYHKIATVYSAFEKIYVAQDNWSVHQHPDVLNALKDFPHIEPVWLPTYSPWLNPIEKLWRWLRQAVLRMHHLARDWKELRNRVRLFIQQFDHGSTELLRYVGLLGDGSLALAIAN